MIGVDLVAVARFRRLKRDAPLFTRLFTEHERAYCLQYRDPATHFAGIFAAKEAASKALGTRAFSVLALEIRHDRSGVPLLYRRRGKRLRARLSISHDRTFAVAVAIVEL
jgi:holo-[acyl-carrier protein] synthase